MKRKRVSPDIDSMELKLFDKRGDKIFQWNKAPGNIKKGIKTIKQKGIDIRGLLNDL
jgi:hypothetical protein